MSIPLAWFLVFCLGACIGSFLNVCISRLPENESIVHPGSRCPFCRSPIRYSDNIPLLSFLWLKGRCRQCSAQISIRYPLIEALTGFMACFAVLKYGPTLPALLYFIFIAALITVTFIDIDHRIIPDEISLGGIPLGLAASFFLPGISLTDAMLGILAGGGILLSVAKGYKLLTGNEGMGGGDIKLLAMIGAFIGWQGVFFTIFSASLIGTMIGLILMAVHGKNLKLAIPFGPFLSIGAIIYIFLGQFIIHWYFFSSRIY